MQPVNNHDQSIFDPADRIDHIHWLRFVSLFVAASFGFLANGLQATLVPIRAQMEMMTVGQISLMSSMFYGGYVLGSLLVPKFVERSGHIRCFTALASIVSALALCFPLFVTPEIWIILRLLIGTCFAGMVIVMESWLNAESTVAMRAKTLAVYQIVVLGSWGASQWLLPLAPLDGFELFILVSMCFSLSLVPIALTRSNGPCFVEPRRSTLKELVKTSPSAFLGLALLGVVVASVWGLAPSWVKEQGFNAQQLSITFSGTLLLALFLQWPLGALSDKFDRRLVAASALTLALVASMSLSVTQPENVFMITLFVICIGGLSMPCYAVLVAHANDHVDASKVIALSSALVLVYGFGAAIGPLATGYLYALLPGTGLFYGISAALFVSIALLTSRKIFALQRTSKSDASHFISVPQTSHAILSLHDRIDSGSTNEPS